MTAIPNVFPVIGNITEDLELKNLQDGTAVVNFSIASTPSRFDRESNSFKDGETVFYRASGWRRDAENLAKSLGKGDRVIAIVEAKPNSYEKDGVKVNGIEFEVKEIAASLAFATVAVTRNPKGGGGNSAPTRSDAQAAAPAAAAAPAQSAPAAAPAAAPAGDDDFS